MSVENLSGKEAVAEIKKIADGQMALLCTFSEDKMFPRPMGTSGIDEDGTVWFFSRRESNKNRQIKLNPRVQILYSRPDKAEFLSLEGRAIISRDQAKIDELWSPILKTWFNQGKDDPEITLISIKPTAGRYWDTKHNKIITLAIIAVGAVLGKPMEDAKQGRLAP